MPARLPRTPADVFESTPYVIKPVHSKEEACIEIVGIEESCSTPGPYRAAPRFESPRALRRMTRLHRGGLRC
jgi:hypothetical protein